MRKLIPLLVAGLLALGCSGPAAADTAPAEHQAATWKSTDLDFLYLGRTTLYTCDGLRDKMKDILLRLGARKDLTVYASGCFSPDRPSKNISVQIHMAVLQPADGGPAGAVDSQWTPVNLMGFDGLGDNECELVDQIKDYILPAFKTRNVKVQTGCVPHQETRGVVLKVEVLKAAAS
jgi:hypothetical protein